MYGCAYMPLSLNYVVLFHIAYREGERELYLEIGFMRNEKLYTKDAFGIEFERTKIWMGGRLGGM